MIRFTGLACLIFFCLSCNLSDAIKGSDLSDVKFKKAIHTNQYSVMVPEFTTPNKDLHEEATIQYANLLKEFYVIVINESKQELQETIDENELMLEYFPSKKANVDSYYDFVIKSVREKGENLKLADSSITSFNDMKARIVSVSGKLDGHKVFYRIGVLEGKKELYQVFTWTMDKYKEKHQPIMDSVIRSLREYN